MQEEYKDLKQKFKKIQGKGWIEATSKYSKEYGLVFEKMLGLNQNEFHIPDFNGIEIKCHRPNSISKIHLFSCSPDGSQFLETHRLSQKYGYPDKDLPSVRVLKASFNSINNQLTKFTYIFRLQVDYKLKRVWIYVLDYHLQLIDKSAYWTFDLLKERFEGKMKYLALIEVLVEYKFGKKWFKYNHINFYKAKNFECFLDLIEKGIIFANINIGVFKGNYRFGQLHDHGTAFSIEFNNLEYLYEKVYI